MGVASCGVIDVTQYLYVAKHFSSRINFAQTFASGSSSKLHVPQIYPAFEFLPHVYASHLMYRHGVSS